MSSRAGNATVLIFNNLWGEPSEAVAKLPSAQVIWGFPGGGGGFFGNNTLRGGFLKTVFLQSASETASPERHQAIRSLFNSAGFKVAEQKNFRGWLWFHFIINAGMAAEALKVGGYSGFYDSADAMKEAFLLMREMLPVLIAKGDKPGLGTRLLVRMPAGLCAFALQKVMKRGSIAREIMEYASDSGHTSYFLTSLYPLDVLKEARRLGLALPKLTALEAVFSDVEA